MTTVLTVVVVLCFAYLVLVNLIALVFLAVGAVENAVRRHDEDSTDYQTLAASRFTIPVSVIVAAYNEGTVIESTVSSFLGFDYPEFEVVVVNDGSTDDTLDRLREAFDLAPYEVFVRHVFPAQPVRAIYRSATHPNLFVVDKENGGKADAWNAALNVARYRYVCGVDADTVFDPSALLQVMRFPMTDPARVIGVTSQIQTASQPEKVLACLPASGGSIAASSACTSTSTSSERSSTTGSPGRSSGSCSALPAAFRSGVATCSRRWAATRPSSRVRTSS